MLLLSINILFLCPLTASAWNKYIFHVSQKYKLNKVLVLWGPVKSGEHNFWGQIPIEADRRSGSTHIPWDVTTMFKNALEVSQSSKTRLKSKALWRYSKIDFTRVTMGHITFCLVWNLIYSVHLNLRTTRVWVGAIVVEQKHPNFARISLKGMGIIAQPITRFFGVKCHRLHPLGFQKHNCDRQSMPACISGLQVGGHHQKWRSTSGRNNHESCVLTNKHSTVLRSLSVAEDLYFNIFHLQRLTFKVALRSNAFLEFQNYPESIFELVSHWTVFVTLQPSCISGLQERAND